MIRRADPGQDGAACAAIYAPYVCETAISFERVPPTAEEMGARIERVQATHDWLVAEAAGSVAGFAYAAPHRERAAYCWAADVAVYVAHHHAGRGIGRALYGELLERLHEQGVHVVCAGITLPNAASVALHEAFGFRPVGIYRDIGFKAGSWHDVGWWQLALRPAAGPPPEPRSPVG